MKLEEFDLDLPYVVDLVKVETIMKENNCSLIEAKKNDYEQNWKEKRRFFRLQTRCVSSMLERIFCELETVDCWKILVECVDEIKEERILNLSGVHTVQVILDYSKFMEASDYIKKYMACELLEKGIKRIVEEKGWEFEPFQKAILKVKELDFRNEWVWKKPVKSPDKKYSAEIFCNHEVNNIHIYIIIKDKKGNEVARKKLITELPDEFAYSKHLGQVKWLSNTKAVLLNKKGDCSWAIDI